MDLSEILKSDENVIVYVDTNKISEVGTLPKEYLERVRITPRILEEALDCKTFREDENVLSALETIPRKSVESIIQGSENEDELVGLSNVVFGNSFFDRIAADSKNQAANLLGKKALSPKEHFLGSLYEMAFYALTNAMSPVYKFADKTMKKQGNPGKTLTFNFTSKEAANHFKTWLCESGEQSYWDWMECREQDEEGPITGLEFDYWNEGIIDVKCGRLAR